MGHGWFCLNGLVEGGCFPTHDAVELRHGWGTELCGGWGAVNAGRLKGFVPPPDAMLLWLQRAGPFGHPRAEVVFA